MSTISALREGDLVLVRPGASVPADGIVQSGKSDVNESMITGESVPVPKVEGAKVIAGTVNGSGSLRVKVTGTGERTALANIMRLVEQAQTSRSRAQALADRAAFVLTIVAVVTGALTLVVWLAVGATGAFAVERLVSVLVIACPHALGPRRAVGGGHLHQSRRAVGTARPRSTRSRGGAQPHDGGLRQDRHADAG